MKKVKIPLAIIFALVMLCAFTASAEVAASGSHALYLDESGAIWGWGSNDRKETSAKAETDCVTLPIKLFENAVQIACGRQFSLALDISGDLWIWGDNSDGKITGAEGIISSPAACKSGVLSAAASEKNMALLLEGGEVEYWDGEKYISFDIDAVKIACGADFALFVTDAGEAYVYGNGDYIGAEANTDEPTKIKDGIKDVYAAGQTGMLIANDGQLYVFGASGGEGRLGIDTSEWISAPTANGVTDARKGVAGVSVSGAIDENGALYVWGCLYSLFTSRDEEGFMRMTYAEDRLITYGKTPIALYQNVSDCAIGDAFIVLELADGTLLAWGSNDSGQCGDGERTEFSIYLEQDEDGEDDAELEITSYRQNIFPVTIEIPKQ